MLSPTGSPARGLVLAGAVLRSTLLMAKNYFSSGPSGGAFAPAAPRGFSCPEAL